MYFVLTLVESMYFVLTRMPCKSYRRRTMSSCDVFQALINPLFVDFIQFVIQLFQVLINSLFVDFIQSVIQLFQALINSLFVDFIQSVIQLFQALINSLFVDFIQSVMQLFVCSCFYPRHNLTAARASPQRLST